MRASLYGLAAVACLTIAVPFAARLIPSPPVSPSVRVDAGPVTTDRQDPPSTTTTADWRPGARYAAMLEARGRAIRYAVAFARNEQDRRRLVPNHVAVVPARRALQSRSTAGRRCGHGCIHASYPCAIPAYICARESGYIIDIYNPNGNASGKYQVIRSTWKRFHGYLNAADAPESVQDEFARLLWNRGAGCSNWSAC